MGIFDIILLIITVLLIVEAVVEARRKNWLALALSIAFLALIIYITSPVYRHLWSKISPPAASPTAPAAPGTP